MNDFFETFFKRIYEIEINQKLQELDYSFPRNEFLIYIKKIINTDVNDFLNWIDKNPFFTIDSTDMPQISDFNNSFYNVVFKIIKAGDKGLRYVDIGKILQNDNVDRSDIANRKYGENHAKAAEYLGYLYSMKFYYYVSCIGYSLDFLNDDEKAKLFTRLLIRTNLFKAIYVLSKQNSSINFRSLFDLLSDQTYKRRLGGTKLILFKLQNSKDYDFSEILSKIKF